MSSHLAPLPAPLPPAAQVGAYLAWPVRILMIITAPISWPISKLLDWLLGEESALFRCCAVTNNSPMLLSLRRRRRVAVQAL